MGKNNHVNDSMCKAVGSRDSQRSVSSICTVFEYKKKCVLFIRWVQEKTTCPLNAIGNGGANV